MGRVLPFERARSFLIKISTAALRQRCIYMCKFILWLLPVFQKNFLLEMVGKTKKTNNNSSSSTTKVGKSATAADKKQWYEKAKVTKAAKKELGLPVSVGKLRKLYPPGQRFGKKALEVISLYIGFRLNKLVDDLIRESENGKHLVSPQMCANIFNNENKRSVFPNRVAGFNNEPRVVHHRKPKKNGENEQGEQDKDAANSSSSSE